MWDLLRDIRAGGCSTVWNADCGRSKVGLRFLEMSRDGCFTTAWFDMSNTAWLIFSRRPDRLTCPVGIFVSPVELPSSSYGP